MKGYLFTDTHYDSLMASPIVIYGKNPLDAIRTHLQEVKIRRAKDDAEKRNCDYILQACVEKDNGRVSILYKAPMLCYVRSEEP